MKVVLPLLFTAGCYAACNSVTSDGDMLIANCTDEVTGESFDYLDMDGSVKRATESSTIDAASMMYELYLEGAANITANDAATTANPLQRRKETVFWNECNAGDVSGVCSNAHVISYTGSLSSFSTSVKNLISSVNTAARLSKANRSVCSNDNSYGTICLSWAAYYKKALTGTEASALNNGCTQTCQQAHYSCQSRIEPTGAATEYFCISNRATGCTENTDIYAC